MFINKVDVFSKSEFYCKMIVVTFIIKKGEKINISLKGDHMFQRRNKIAFILQIIACAFILVGLFGGIEIGEESGAFGWSFFFGSFVAAVLIFGFSEVINLLDSINKKMPEIALSQDNEKELIQQQQVQIYEGYEEKKAITLSETEKENIKEYFKKKNQEVKGIIATPFDYAIVELPQSTCVVELGGFQPKVLTKQQIASFEQLKEWVKNKKGISL